MGRLASAVLLAVALVAGVPGAASAWTVRSPGGALEAAVVQDAPGGPLRLEMRRSGTPALSSALGITTSDGDFSSGLTFARRTDRTVDERFDTVVGKRLRHHLRANEMTLAFRGPRGADLQLVVRAADDGIAYRYVLPGRGEVDVTGESSAFTAPSGTRAWLLPWRPNYENHYEDVPLAAARPRIYGFPALLSVGRGAYALITESDVDGRYAASQMTVAAGEPGVLHVTLPEPSVHGALPLATPWRVAVIGSLEAVTESDLALDLGTPSQLQDTGWIQPGTVAWSWWSDGSSPRSCERQKQYVDYAASVGWPYVLVDEGWSPEWMPDLVRYAADRGVRIIVWSRWDDLETQAERDALLPLWKSWGVAGVKVDFMNSDTQARMAWYDAIARDTAAQHLLLNFHGATPPRGIQRTWPHVLAVEGVRGAEDYNLGYLTPTHNVTLPFTRNAIGSMDYTPVTFSADRREVSAGHELALSVVYESGLQHPADSIESYSGRGVAEAFLQRVPTVWDDTELVSGFPGREATFARRSGDDWFVGSIVAGAARTIDVPLRFLPAGRSFVAEVVDDSGHDDLVVTRRRVDQGDRLRVPVSEDGGFAAVLCAEEACLDEARLTRLEVSTERRFVAPGGSVAASATLTNRSSRVIEDARVSLAAPAGWRLHPTSGSRWPSLAPGESRRATWSLTSPAGAAPGAVVRPKATAVYGSGGRRMERVSDAELMVQPSAPPAGDAYLSDLNPFNNFNSVGPLERDMSNGGGAAGDGGPLTIEGRTFAKGLGGNAHSEQAYYLGGRCSTLDAVVGVDDEVGAAGTVVFQVWADDRKLFDSGRLTGGDRGVGASVPLGGVEELKLVMADSGDHIDDDHGDWAAARVDC
jgi:alpha-glucosidase